MGLEGSAPGVEARFVGGGHLWMLRRESWYSFRRLEVRLVEDKKQRDMVSIQNGSKYLFTTDNGWERVRYSTVSGKRISIRILRSNPGDYRGPEVRIQPDGGHLLSSEMDHKLVKFEWTVSRPSR